MTFIIYYYILRRTILYYEIVGNNTMPYYIISMTFVTILFYVCISINLKPKKNVKRNTSK